MDLLRTHNIYHNALPEHGLYRFSAWLEVLSERDLHIAMCAANINILRRSTPYCYLFAYGYSCATVDLDTGFDRGYMEGLKRKDVSLPIRFTYLDLPADRSSAVITIGVGDVLPFVPLLDEEEYSMVLLSCPLDWTSIEPGLAALSLNADRVRCLLGRDGMAVTLIDSVNLCVYTPEPEHRLLFGL